MACAIEWLRKRIFTVNLPSPSRRLDGRDSVIVKLEHLMGVDMDIIKNSFSVL